MADPIDKEFTPVNVPLNGRCITAVDPSEVGLGNFSEYVNFRPGEKNPEPVRGMTKINTAALANVNATCGIQFRKDSPVTENHVLVHAFDGTGNNGKVYRNSAIVPAQGAFTATPVFTDTDTDGANVDPRFAIAPGGAAVYCNGSDTVMWYGLEGKIVHFADYDPNGSFNYDYTRQLTNDLTDADNLAVLHTHADTIDEDTMLLLHLDNNVTDSSPTTAHTVTNSNVTFSTTRKMGTHCAVFNGTNARLSIPDNSDFDLSGGTWAIDFWISGASIANGDVIYYHGTDASNYMMISAVVTGTTTLSVALKLTIVASGSPVVALTSTSHGVLSGVFTHYAFIENGDNYYIFRDGILKASGTYPDARPADYTGVIYIGNDGGSAYFAGMLDEFRVSDAARWTAPFDPPALPYGQGTVHTAIIQTQLPAQGFNFYVQTANTTAADAKIYCWNGTGYADVGAITGAGATPFDSAGKHAWTFASTAATAKQKMVDGGLAYTYKLVIPNLDAATQLYQVTADMPCQQIQDLWDGSYTPIAAFFKYANSTYNDLSVNVFKEEWDSQNTATFAELDSLAAASDKLYVGFLGRQRGLIIQMIGGHVNTTANTILSVKYFGGASYVSPGDLDDGTAENNISFAKGGVVTWNSPDIGDEFPTDRPGGRGAAPPTMDGIFGAAESMFTIPYDLSGVGSSRPKMYYYEITFSQNLSADVQIYYIAGIPVQKELKAHTFPFEHLNRLWLAKGNEVIASGAGTAQQFNGPDALGFTVGDNSDVVAAASLTSRVGSSIYAILLLFKRNGEIWSVLGAVPDEMVGPLKIARSKGITSHKTLSIIPSYEVAPNLSRPIAVWQGSDAIYMSDGFSVSEISDDIADKFADRKDTVINRSAIAASFGAYDEKHDSYMWCYPDGDETAPNREWAKHMKRNKWYQMERNTKRLKALIPVRDTNGNFYMYGMMAGGYLMRLENGATFDGTAIPYTLLHGELGLHEGHLSVETQVRFIKLIFVANSTVTNRLVLTHYRDGDTYGKVIDAANNIPLAETNRRIKQVVRSVDIKGVLHALKMELESDAGDGFEPLYLTYYIKDRRLDKGQSVDTARTL
jgi:hypothetical protein